MVGGGRDYLVPLDSRPNFSCTKYAFSVEKIMEGFNRSNDTANATGNTTASPEQQTILDS